MMEKLEKLWKDFGPSEDFDDADSLRVSRYGLWLTAVAFGGFMLWAIFVPLSEGVIAFGSLEADGNRKTIQHFEGGIVTDIYVEEGENVTKGQLLVSLDKTQPQARLNLVETRYASTHAMLDRLRAESQKAENIQWSTLGIVGIDPALVESVRQTQQKLFDARVAQVKGEITLLGEKVKQLNNQKKGLLLELDAKREELSYVADELKRLEQLNARGTVDLPRVLAQKKARAQAMGMIARLEAEISSTAISASETELEILQVEYDSQQEIETQTMESQERIFELQEELIAAQDVATRTDIYAPQSGRVFGLAVFTVGGVVPAGEAIMDIVPDSGLVIKAQIRPTDADNVYTGMDARVRLSGLNQRTTPELNGVVTDVSGDAKLDEVTGEQYFEVTVAISKSEIDRVEDNALVPGMPVEVLLKAGQRTAMEYFTDPILDVLRRSMKEG